MTARLLVLAAAAVALALPASAAAKGIDRATIAGPGLPTPILVPGERGPETPALDLADATGLFPSVFETAPDPTVPKPSGELGTRYDAIFWFRGPKGLVRLKQELYPYAEPYPVTHVRAGQPLWDGGSSRGGWYLALPATRATLVAAGLPRTPPAGGGSGGDAWHGAIAAIAAAVLLALGAFAAVAALRARRRLRPATG